MLNNDHPEKDSRYQTAQIKNRLNDVIKQVRTTIECVNDMRAKVLLKTTADLITSLTSAYENYESTRKHSVAPAYKPHKSCDDNMYFSQFKNHFDKQHKNKTRVPLTRTTFAA